MRRTRPLVLALAVLLVVAMPVAVTLASFSGSAAEDDSTEATIENLADRTDETAEILALASRPNVARLAGLGVGLSVGLVAGAGFAYARRGGR